MPKKILLADDSLTIQKVVELTFSDSDYELICVSNGQKALDRIRDERPDLVLADVVMPEKNGYEVCEALKSNPATARIPVMLLSGTFEPFDRDRAERIGADSIVSKPFDSQQLIAQVEALLDRSPASVASDPATATTSKIPVVEDRGHSAPAAHEEPPFDVGFSAEDFTAAVRIPSRGLDPFEEEYGRGDVDSAIAAFEKSRPQAGISDAPSSAAPAPVPPEESREPLSQWLAEEPEKAQEPAAFASIEEGPKPEERVFDIDAETTVAVAGPLPAPSVGLEDSPAEMPQQTVALRLPPEEPAEAALPGAPEFEAEEELPRPALEPPAPAAETVPTLETVPAAEVPHDIEMLAQTSSIPELTQMLSSVARSAGGDLTDEQIEKLARRVVEKLSDRIVREIAWEVIPDMAEIVIKQRIKELEAGVE
ncbi:MAG TPA: response regulator [Thermoanaerobaculia bacterium]|nr:response regulator [Thermoanaerobaculia bacterium]